MAEQTKGSMFRCRARWHEYGEKSSKYFFNLEKSRYNKRVMKSIYTPQGNEVTDPEQILAAQKDFYETLFTSGPNVNFTAKNENDVKITDLEKHLVDKEITLEELGQIVKSMPNGKTPGCDGLPIEFYKVFWNRIGDWVLDAFNYAFQQGTLHISARRGVITLIPKKDKDPHYIKNAT